jgi:uncharacterized integral membrane protein (TIGR00698 family)
MQLRRLLPGVALAAVIAGAAWGLQALETRWLAQPLLESLVLAILLGMAVRNLSRGGTLAPHFLPGVNLCSKYVLELAVFLLGGTMNLRALFAGGPRLLFGVALSTILTLVVTSLVARRLFGLERTPATLIAVGNAICGNSAIAAVAPLIGATAAEVAGAVAFTAVLGVGLVLALPMVILPLLHFNHTEYGTLVGMTVYAVPQVLAASFPVSELSGQTATLVKLTRVLFLAPLALWFSLTRRTDKRPTMGQLLPWFIVGFVLLAALRTVNVIPAEAAAWLKEISRLLTLLAMAALGLGVDVRALRAAGAKTTAAVCFSLLFLLLLSAALIKLLKLGS